MYFSYLTSFFSCSFLSISDTDAAEFPISSEIAFVETFPLVFKLMENIAFKYLYPNVYKDLEEIFKKNYHLYRKDWEFENSKIEVISNEAPDCLDDFIEFFDAFVKKDEKIQLELKNSLQQTKYNELCPLNSYDYYGRSLIPRHFFEKYQIV